ncbi:hypothetical protein SteCoe_9826 [Stentor coeruleus]|uniref:HECT domain-containing protein n=1 Tax=Stentor coeruleus TaxID=5963 RepID=A0A1R2CGV1_9CILI|nr:hypothetical protein SteCoe_9826 [Stentor coeruleus]
MGNTSSEISDRVSSLSIEDLKKTYTQDLELLSYNEQLYDPLTLQFNPLLDQYQFYTKSSISPSTDLLEHEISYAFAYTKSKHEALKSSLINTISSQIPTTPFYDIFHRRLQALCGIYESILRQDKLRDKLLAQDQEFKSSSSSLPVSAQLGISFGLSSLLLMLKKTIASDGEMFMELVSETSMILSQYQPMSCVITDSCIEKALEKVCGFFESVLKGEIRGVTQENQLASISPLLGIALVSGNVTAAFSIIAKFLTGIQDKAFANIVNTVMPVIKALSRIAMMRKVEFYWASCDNVKLNKVENKDQNQKIVVEEYPRIASAVGPGMAYGEEFSYGKRYYEMVLEKANGVVSFGVCDSRDPGNRFYMYSSNGNLQLLTETSTVSTLSVNDKVGVFIDFPNKSISFYKNKSLISGPIKLELSSVKLNVGFTAGDSEVKIIIPEIPDGLKGEINEYEERNPIHPIFAILQSSDLSKINTGKLSSVLVGAFLLALIDKNNEKHRKDLEKRGKSAEVKIKELLSIDVREPTLAYLYQILTIAAGNRFDPEIGSVVMLCALRLTKSHLLASRNFPQVQLSSELRVSFYTILQQIMSGNFKIQIKAESACTLSECFEVFFSSPVDQIPFLNLMLKNYKNSFKVSQEETKMIEEMLERISQPFALFDVFSFDLQPKEIEKFIISLIDLAQNLSITSLKEKVNLVPVMTLLSSCLKCLICQYSKSNFRAKDEEIILNIYKKIVICSQAFLKELKKSPDTLRAKAKDTLISHVPTTFFTSLILCKLSLDFITECLEPALSLLNELKDIEPILPETLNTIAKQKFVYESEHPYKDNQDITKVFKVPYAEKYTLTFDSSCATESNCDYLKLYSDENKANLLFNWTGTGFPTTTETEVKSPVITFEFHSDSSQTNWGYKVNIIAEVKTKTYKSIWPNDLQTSLGMLVAGACKKLICFEFEDPVKVDFIEKIISSPLCKYGIKDKILGPFGIVALLPEKLISLATKDPSQTELITGLGKELMIKEKKKNDLMTYSATFGRWGKRISDVDIIEEIINGSDNVVSCWRDLKQASGVKGPASNIGGNELNQAERAIFAVFATVFDITDTINSLFLRTAQVGNSIKHIVKQSTNIRNWAQKRKQELIDAGKVIGYTEIGKDIVEKCTLILNSEFRKGLQEAGVELKLTELTEMVKHSASLVHTTSSKWKTVKGAVATAQKLGSLMSITKPKPIKSDIVEVGKVWNIVLTILNSDLTVEEIIKLLEKRRVRGLSRALGFKFLNTLMSETLNSEILEVFNQCVRGKNGKIDFSQGLEATDPVLLTCVQSSYFSVYKILFKTLSEFNTENLLDLYMLLNLIESVNYPILETDLHYFYDLNISGLINKLLEWSKGSFSNLKVSKIFTVENCVTSLKLITSEEEGSIRIPDTEDLFLVFIKNETKQPISEFLIKENLIAGYEDSVGPITIGSTTKYILIKRSPPTKTQHYLFSILPGCVPDFKDYEYFLTLEDEEEKLKIAELKQKISDLSFLCLKLFMCSLNTNSLQETIIHEIFTELKDVRTSYSLSLDETCKGNTWIGKINVPTSLQKNPVERFLKKFYKEVDGELSLRKLIETHVRAVDHGLKGVLKEDDEEMMGDGARKLLKKHPEFRNTRGEVDFFKYLVSIYEKRNEMDSKSKEYLAGSKLFFNLPKDYYEAAEQCFLGNVSAIIMYAVSIATLPDFITYLGAFIESETPGFISIGTFPEEFKNSEGKYDFYLSLNKISSDPPKYPNYYSDVSFLINEFGVFPSSCLSLNAEQILIEDYQGTLMWLLFSQCSSEGVLRALSRKTRVQTMLLKALSESQELSALSMLVLSAILPSQHSYESLHTIWNEISSSQGIPKKSSSDFISFLLYSLGFSTGFYLQTSNWNKTKRSSMDAFELLKKLISKDRWKEKMMQMFKENIESLNKKLEDGIMFSEIEAGVILFLAMNGPMYSGMDYVLQPLNMVRLDQACVGEGILWSIGDESCKIFSIQSDSFHNESRKKIVGVIQNSDFFKNFSQLDLFDQLLKTWSLIQNYNPSSIKTPAKLFIGNKLIIKRLESLVLETLVTLSDKKQNIQRKPTTNTIMWRKFVTIKELLSSKLENKAKSEATKQLTNEEILARLSALDEKNQILVTEVASLGYPQNLILSAIDTGLSNKEDIIENILQEGGPKPIFTLNKWSDGELEIIDLSETGVFYQSSKGHMVITTTSNSQDKKVYGKNLDESIFHNTKWFNDYVTIFICISGTPSQHKCEYGVKIGELDIKFESVVESTQIDVSGKFSLRVLTQSQYVFRIFASVNGDLELVGDSFSMRLCLNEPSVFTGARIGSMSLYLKEGSRVELKGFSIYEGKIESQVKFYEEDLESKDNFSKFVKPRIIESGYTKNRLCLMGMPGTLAKSLADQYCDLEKCIQEAIKLDSGIWVNTLTPLVSEFIYTLKIFDTVGDIEKGYEEVGVFENGERSTIGLTNRKVLTMKKSAEGNSKRLSEISLEEIPNSQLIGEMLLDPTQESQKIYGIFSDKPPYIKNIAYVISKNSLRVGLPAGYTFLNNKEGSAINLASKADKNLCIFLAYTTNDFLINFPVCSLTSISQPIPTFGLLNTKEAKEEKDDSDVYKNYSILELISSLFDLEEQRVQNSGKDFMLSISAHKPEALVTSAENKGIAHLINMFQSDYSALIPFVNAVTTSGNKNVIEKLLAECIFQIISAATNSDGDLTSKVYESPHSYNNNADIDEEIYFPGASKLIFTFDSQCYTENTYDYLAFYKKTGREEEIKKFSGTGEAIWQTFEHVGDRVYMYFHSDGSSVFWGYKFTVKPVVLRKKKTQRKINLPAVLCILDHISKQGYSFLLEKFFKKETLLPLFILLHKTENLETIENIIGILSRLIITVEATQKVMLEILLSQANIMKTGASDGPNLVLISIMSLLCKFHESRSFIIREKWFVSFYNCYFDMKDLTKDKHGLDLFLFEAFKTGLEKDIEKTYESQHPYTREVRSEQISFPGASSLKITFDPNSTLDEGDEIYFSSDNIGRKPLGNLSKNEFPISWSTSLKGPDISTSNNNLTVTRTNSSGWGIAVSNEPLSDIAMTISVSIDNSDTSEYWYIGLMDATNTNLTTNMASDCGFKAWSWKRNGDFMKQGSSVSKGSAYGFSQGDIVQISVNFHESTVSFSKNGEQMHSFDDVSGKVYFAMSFGGSSQIATISSAFEVGEALASIKKRKITTPSDSVFFHFPINSGIYSSYKWENTNESFLSCTPLTISRTGGEGPSIHMIQNQLTCGRYYCEFEFTTIADKTLVVPFVAKESINRTQSVLGSCAGYKNTGNIIVGSNTTSCKGFKTSEIIGMYLDFTKPEVRFYKNKLLVAACKIDLSNEPYRFGVMLSQAGQDVKVYSTSEPPEDVDLLGVRQQLRYGHGQSWGYKFKVTPIFSDRTKECMEQALKHASEEDRNKWKEYYEKFSTSLRNGAAEELVTYIDESVISLGKSSMSFASTDINPSPESLIYYKNLEKLPVKDIQELYKIIKLFNSNVKSNLSMFNLHISETPTDLQKAFLRARKYIFFDIKKDLFNTQLDKTKNDSRPDIIVDRTKAMRYKSLGRIDTQAQFSVFGQVLRSMNQKNNTDFRNTERVFKVAYRGEGAIDAGGPYNEVISNICDELQSNYLQLLVETQNHLNNIGEHRDAWTINPKKFLNAEEIFVFLGKLLGVAIRTQNNLNLSLAPLAWKKIVVDSLELYDLKSIDEVCYQMIEILYNLQSKGITKENFSTAFSDECFTTRLSNGEVIELVPGGKEMIVTYDNSLQYAKFTVAARLTEGDEYYKYLRQGMSAVIPIDLLNLFSWKQVETLVCGAVDVKVDVLRANTEYSSGTNESDPHIGFFWEVLTEMTPKERQLFLRFVWGRSRLPASKTFTHMKISKLIPKGPVDNYLPVTHTCFFTIDLPPYNTKEVMRLKLLYAITHCTAIDLDTTPTGGWDEND